MAELLRPTEDSGRPHPGDLRRGTILAVSPEGLTVDIRAQQQGWIPRADLEKVTPDERAALRQGQEVLVYVTGAPEAAGPVQLSLYLAQKEQDWLRAEDLRSQDACWEGRVNGYNKGGLVVPFGHIRGFVPASQVTGISRGLADEERLSRLSQFVGQQLSFKVVEVDRRQRRLVLSERLGRVAQRAHQQEHLLRELRRGDICHGRIRALTEYGAFLDLGGMVGLIHRTELAWFRVEHPCEIVQEGQEVDAYVLRVARDRGRLSLSLKRTYPDPWPTVMERYQLDQLVEGRIIRRTGAGLFLFLDDGNLGFISEGDVRQSGWAEEDLAIGRRVVARLVRIDGARRRLGLSLRRVRPEELAEWRGRSLPREVDEPPSAAGGSGVTATPPVEEPAPAASPVAEVEEAGPAAEGTLVTDTPPVEEPAQVPETPSAEAAVAGEPPAANDR